MSTIRGIDVIKVKKLNAELLAPGTVPGRTTVWTVAAIQKMGKEALFA